MNLKTYFIGLLILTAFFVYEIGQFIDGVQVSLR